jgi:hemin uptake protein HemP
VKSPTIANLPNVLNHLTKPMIFLIDIVDSEHQVIVYEDIPDLIRRVEWQDIFEGKSIIIDEKGIEYEWDSTQKNEIGTVHNYTIIPTSRVSELITQCLERIKLDENINEFSF